MSHVQNLFCDEKFEAKEEEFVRPQHPGNQWPRLSVKALKDPVLLQDDRVLTGMLLQEKPSVTNNYFTSKQPGLRPHMRRIVIDWMLEVCEDQQTGMEVFLLATHYLDTFLSSVTITKSQFQLCAATCLLLASKFSACVPLSSQILSVYSDHSILPEEILQFELVILNSLQWQLSVITAQAFVSHLLPLLRLPSNPLLDLLIYQAVSSFEASHLPPSLIAAAAIFCSEIYSSSASSFPHPSTLLYLLSNLTKHSSSHISRASSFLAGLAGMATKEVEEKEEECVESYRPVTPRKTLDICESLMSF